MFHDWHERAWWCCKELFSKVLLDDLKCPNTIRAEPCLSVHSSRFLVFGNPAILKHERSFSWRWLCGCQQCIDYLATGRSASWCLDKWSSSVKMTRNWSAAVLFSSLYLGISLIQTSQCPSRFPKEICTLHHSYLLVHKEPRSWAMQANSNATELVSLETCQQGLKSTWECYSCTSLCTTYQCIVCLIHLTGFHILLNTCPNYSSCISMEARVPSKKCFLKTDSRVENWS